MFPYNVTERPVITLPNSPNIRREEPDKNILVGHLKLLPDEVTFSKSGLARFKFTDFKSHNFSALCKEAQSNIGTFINEDLYEDIIILISIGMEPDLASEIFEQNKANRNWVNPIDKARQIKIKVVALNDFAIIILTRFFQELAERHESTRGALSEFNEFQLKPSSEFDEITPNIERRIPKPPESNNVDDWFLWRAEMLYFGVDVGLDFVALRTGKKSKSMFTSHDRWKEKRKAMFGLKNFNLLDI